MLTQDHDVAVNHLTGWSGTNWAVAWSLLILGVVVFGIAMRVLRTSVSSGEDFPWTVGSSLGVLIALVMQAVCLWKIARHLPEFRWTFLVALALIGASSAAAYRLADPSRNHAYRSYRGTFEKWIVHIPAGIAIAIGVGTVIGDGLNRAAAWFPMAVGALIALIIVGVLACVVSTICD